MIPTRKKEKIPTNLSYPVGAKLISSALTGVPQYKDLTISFSKGMLASYYKKASQMSRPFYILSVYYVNPEPKYGIQEESWSIAVSAVPRNYRPEVRKLLYQTGFAKVRNWLALPRSPVWGLDTHILSLSFDPETKKIIFEET